MPARRFAVPSLALCLLLLVSTRATAQPAIGVIGGLNITNIHFDITGFGSASFDHRTGGFVGATFVTPIRLEGLGVEVDALLQQAGTREDLEDFEIALTYFGLPVLARYDLKWTGNRRIHVYGGPSFNFKMGESIRIGNDERSNLDGFEGSDIHFVYGGGVDLGRIRIDVRLLHGLSNIVRDPKVATLPVDFEVTNRGVMIGAGYTFGRH
jgi:hypothetical protein